MSSEIIAVIILVVLLVAAGVAAAIAAASRRVTLRKESGSEYDRVASEDDGRPWAETEPGNRAGRL